MGPVRHLRQRRSARRRIPRGESLGPEVPEEYAKQVNLNPMKRFGDPENDIAPVVAFLAGPDSCYYSGQSVIVDGANSIMP